MRKTDEQLPSTTLFDYIKMFNHLVVIDKDLAARLPTTEFELSFNPQGDIYIDQMPLGVNIKLRHAAAVEQYEAG
jgi:hypothetical protein